MGNIIDVVMVATTQAKNANASLKIADSFDSTMRNNDVVSFEVGDEFDMPTDYTGKVCRNYFDPTNPDPNEAKRHAEYIYVNCGGVAKQFYPSSCTKTAFVVDHSKNDGITVERIKASGNVVARFKKGTTVQEGMELLKGLHIKVADVQTVWIRSRFGAHAGEDVQTKVLTLTCSDLDENGLKSDEK